MDDYNQGKDIYMELAKMYKPDMEYEKLKKKYRGKCKTLVLAIHYGMSPETLSHQLDMTLEETKNLMQGYFDRYSVAKQMIDESIDYCKKTGYIKTIFGDKLAAKDGKRKANTQGINYKLQNGASVAMTAGFFNMDWACRVLEVPIHPLSIIHDSNQNLTDVVDLFYLDRIYYKFFREYERNYIGVDFKYDLELMKNFKRHTVYDMNFETNEMTLSGPKIDLEYYEDWLATKWKFKCTDKGILKPAEPDWILDFSRNFNEKKNHHYCELPNIRLGETVSERKYKIDYDWSRDDLIHEISKLPLDVTSIMDPNVGRFR